MRSMVEGHVQSGVAYGLLCPSTTAVGGPLPVADALMHHCGPRGAPLKQRA